MAYIVFGKISILIRISNKLLVFFLRFLPKKTKTSGVIFFTTKIDVNLITSWCHGTRIFHSTIVFFILPTLLLAYNFWHAGKLPWYTHHSFSTKIRKSLQYTYGSGIVGTRTKRNALKALTGAAFRIIYAPDATAIACFRLHDCTSKQRATKAKKIIRRLPFLG